MPKKDFYQVSLKVILKNDKDEILMLKERPEGTFANFYDLPGGRIDEEEFSVPFAQIIQREIAEEIGDVEISVNPKPVAVGRHSVFMTEKNEDLHVLYLFFEAKLVNGQIKISNEHTGFKWVDLKKCEPAKLFKSGILEGIKMYLSGLCKSTNIINTYY